VNLYVLLVTGTREHPSEENRRIISQIIDGHMLAANTISPEYPRGRCFVVLEGGADGVDAFAQYHGKLRGSVPGTFAANWDHHRKGAGPVRNGVLLETALGYHALGHEVHVEAFPGPLVDPKKPGGTRDMIGKVQRSALANRLRVTEIA
jgi:hypothetical protein